MKIHNEPPKGVIENSSDSNDNVGKLLTKKDAAKYTGFKISRINHEVFNKRIPYTKVGASVRFTKEQLDEWIRSQAVGVKHE